jgi:hypothetical protein
MKIISALWGGLDVKSVVEERFINNEFIKFCASNDYFTDPMPGFEKHFQIAIEDDGEIIMDIVYEGAHFEYPKQKYKPENTLVLTSCNRVEQVLLALAVNSKIIKEPFNLVIVDGSTPHLDANGAINMHRGDDPYNLINNKNYNPNWELFEEYVQTIPNIKDYRIIHQSPRLEKQVGEANLMAVGLTAAAMMGSKYAIKLSGVCHLKYNIFEHFVEYCGENDVSTYKRTGYPQKSTRVLLCRPDKFGATLVESGWGDWVYTYDFIERKLERIITNSIPKSFNHLQLDERDIIVDEGLGRNDHREIITQNLEKHGLLDSDDKWIKHFIEGNIW